MISLEQACCLNAQLATANQQYLALGLQLL
jgi:hypothetical protein